MDDKIKIYESLLDERASLEKECRHLSIEYAREFGDEIEKLFTLKVETITLKKKIAFCVTKSYRNQAIDLFELERYIDEEIVEYQTKLKELIRYNKEVKKEKGKSVSYEDFQKIKKLYHKIAHLVHPDLHPEYSDDKELMDLWDKAVSAYESNNYKDLLIIYDQIVIKVKEGEIYIENIDEKIEEMARYIDEIKENEPYRYKFILDDKDEISAFHEELKKEIADYDEYKVSLEEELGKFKMVEGHVA